MDTDEQAQQIRAELTAARNIAKLSQTELAQRLGNQTYASIYNWERGVNEPKLSNLIAWAHALGFAVALVAVGADDDPR